MNKWNNEINEKVLNKQKYEKNMKSKMEDSINRIIEKGIKSSSPSKVAISSSPGSSKATKISPSKQVDVKEWDVVEIN